MRTKKQILKKFEEAKAVYPLSWSDDRAVLKALQERQDLIMEMLQVLSEEISNTLVMGYM